MIPLVRTAAHWSLVALLLPAAAQAQPQTCEARAAAQPPAVVELYTHERKADAARWYATLSQAYPNFPLVAGDANSLPARFDCDEFVRRYLIENRH